MFPNNQTIPTMLFVFGYTVSCNTPFSYFSIRETLWASVPITTEMLYCFLLSVYINKIGIHAFYPKGTITRIFVFSTTKLLQIIVYLFFWYIGRNKV